MFLIAAYTAIIPFDDCHFAILMKSNLFHTSIINWLLSNLCLKINTYAHFHFLMYVVVAVSYFSQALFWQRETDGLIFLLYVMLFV